MEESTAGKRRIEPQQPAPQGPVPAAPPPRQALPPRPERQKPPRREPAAPEPAPARAAEPPDTPLPGHGGSSGSRLVVLVLSILAAIELAGVAYFYTQFYTQSLITGSLQGKLDQSTAAAKAQEIELARQSDMISNLKGEFVKVDEERRGLKKNIEEHRRTVAEIEARLKETAESATSAKANLARQEQIAVYLRTRLRESKGTELQLMDRLEAASKEKTDLEAKLARAREGEMEPEVEPAGDDIPLRETVVTETAAPNEITGQVLVSHEKYGFVIVNLGSEDGITVGNEGIIEQKGVQVGKAKVKKLYPRMCLADVVTVSPEKKIEKNFAVKFTRAPRSDGT